jgi:hypothetical protein
LWLQLIAAVLGFCLSWTFPPGLQAAMIWLFNPLIYLTSFVDIPYLVSIVGYLCGFLVMFFTYRVIRVGWSAAFAWTGQTLSDFSDMGGSKRTN